MKTKQNKNDNRKLYNCIGEDPLDITTTLHWFAQAGDELNHIDNTDSNGGIVIEPNERPEIAMNNFHRRIEAME